MEKPPCIFQAITHFSIRDVEKYGPRFDKIRTLTFEIGSKILPGRYPLVLIKPFPPLGRPGKEMDSLASLRAEGIDSVWAFPKPNDKPWARIEIRGKPRQPSIFIECEQIEVVPGWDETQG